MVELAEIQAAYYMVAATGVLVAAIYYVHNMRATRKTQELALRTQELMLQAQRQTLETRQAQIMMGIFDKFIGGLFDNLLRLNTWKIDSIEDFQAMYQDIDRVKTFSSMFGIYEELGTLVHEDLLHIRLVARMIGYFKRDWEKWGPLIKQMRVVQGDPRLWIEAEYLYERLTEFGKQNPEYNL